MMWRSLDHVSPCNARQDQDFTVKDGGGDLSWFVFVLATGVADMRDSR